MNSLFSVLGPLEGKQITQFQSDMYGILSLTFTLINVILLYRNRVFIKNNKKLEKRLTRLISIIGVIVCSFPFINSFFRADQSVLTRLPLSLCSLNTIIYILALNFKKLEFLHKYMFWFALIGVAFAFIPGVSTNTIYWQNYEFFNYMLWHDMIIVGFFYLLVIRESRPNFKDVLLGSSFLALTTLSIMLPINYFVEGYYMYVGPYSDPSINIFGPWPSTLISMLLVYTLYTAFAMFLTFIFQKHLWKSYDESFEIEDFERKFR